MTEETFQGIPRTKITWNPTINYQKCNSCLKCIEFCKRGVFALQEKPKKPIVKNPNNCKVYCTNCQKQCANFAITHPSQEETQNYLKQLQNNKA